MSILSIFRERPRRSPRQRGIALLMVLGLVAVMITVVTEFMVQSTIDMNLAINARDELQAELNALSALRMRALILKNQTNLRQVIPALLGGATAPMPLGPILEQIPVTCGLLSQMASKVQTNDESPAAGAHADAKHGKAAVDEDFFPGECIAQSRSEHGKIAINLMLSKVGNARQMVFNELVEMLNKPVLRPLFEEDNRSGSHAESPTALVGHILDWIDLDHTEEGTFGDEDRYYQYLRDPYRTKNAPFDSVAELKLVHGVGDMIFALLKENVSVVTSAQQIELGTASPQLIILGLLSAAKLGVPSDQTLQAAGAVLASVRQTKALWGAPSLSGIKQTLSAAGALALFDEAKLQQAFSEKDDSTWYTITASGEMGQARRTIKVTFQTGEGAFYYARLD